MSRSTQEFFGGFPDLYKCHTAYVHPGLYRCLVDNGAACIHARSRGPLVLCTHQNNNRLQGLAFLDHPHVKCEVTL